MILKILQKIHMNKIAFARLTEFEKHNIFW